MWQPTGSGWLKWDKNPADEVREQPGQAAWEQQKEPDQAHEPDREAEALGQTPGHAGDEAMVP